MFSISSIEQSRLRLGDKWPCRASLPLCLFGQHPMSLTWSCCGRHGQQRWPELTCFHTTLSPQALCHLPLLTRQDRDMVSARRSRCLGAQTEAKLNQTLLSLSQRTAPRHCPPRTMIKGSLSLSLSLYQVGGLSLFLSFCFRQGCDAGVDPCIARSRAPDCCFTWG